MKTVIKELQQQKASGLDRVPNEFIKNSGPLTQDFLLATLNTILESEELPNVWKTSYVTLIPKGGDKHNLDNYRGIMISSSIEKIFTKLLGKRLEKDVEERKILGNIQHGFRRGWRCTDALHTLTQIMQHRKKARLKQH